MPRNRLSRLSLAIGLSVAATSALAAPQGFNTARSFAMGGTGVAIAHPAAANAVNPAMLAARNHEWSDDFGLVLPSVNARFADEEEVVDQIDSIQETIDAFDTAVNNNDETEARARAGELHDQLTAFDRDTVRVDAGLGLSLAVPGQRLAVGVFANGNLRATARGEVSQNDLDRLAAIADGSNNPTLLEGDLESRGRVLASAVAETGISFARAFDVGTDNTLQLGISPKYVQLRTYQYTQTVDGFEEDDFDSDSNETTKSGFNLDLGAAYAFGESQQWNAGVAVKNVIPMELDSAFDTTRGESQRTLELDPKVSVGIAHSGDFHVLTAEADLTKQKAFGYGDDTQWLAVGAEFDAFRFAQLRFGARQNLASNSDNEGIEESTQFTAGLGLSPFGARLDIAALVSDADVGAGIELGVAF